VQVSQAYYNQYCSFTAAGAAEQTYTFYGPTQMSLHGYGCAVAIGANCTFRRKALESIGGHGIGLAEDLITSIRMHAAGWQSIYNPVVVSRGLVPEDLGSFCKQQLKWARGVFEVTFEEIPRLFWQLSFWQKLSYLTIGSYYFVGATQFLFTLIPLLYFFVGITPAEMSFVDFVVRGLPIVVISLAIYGFVQRWMAHPETERGLHWRGMILKFACWPVFFLGFLLSVVNAEIPYIPTAKKAVTGYFTPFARPHVVHSALFLMMITGIFVQRRFFMPESELIISAEQSWGMMAFGFIAFLLAMGSLFAALEAHRLKVVAPWESVDLTQIRNDESYN
jgi:cellulose synthase (UDP-forming)